jgi:membrane protease YdiL (CAAX protease family)
MDEMKTSDTLGRHRTRRHHRLSTSSEPTGRRAGWFRRHDLALFLGLAFLVSWAPWPLVALNPDSSPLVPFGPLVGAVTAVLLTGGLGGLRRLLAQLTRWRRASGWYLLAVAGPLTVTAAAAGLTIALGDVPPMVNTPDWTFVAITFVSTLLLTGLFEELGWRGYALPRLQSRFDGLRSALLLGSIWALWHLPELLSDPTHQRPPLPFLLGVLAQSVILAWLYTSTRGSLPITMLSHAATNTAAQFVLPQFTGHDYQLIWWFSTGLWIAAAVVVVAIAGRGLTTNRPDPSRRPPATGAPVGNEYIDPLAGSDPGQRPAHVHNHTEIS